MTNLNENRVRNALVIGAGFIGLEIFENLSERGIQTHLVEAKNSLMPVIDEDMSVWIEEYFKTRGFKFTLGELVERIESSSVTAKSGKSYEADLVILSARGQTGNSPGGTGGSGTRSDRSRKSR